jgi:RNA polymerase sigma-70 factor (ECF subfamily)
MGREEAAQLYETLDVLSHTNREILLLRYQQELSIRELTAVFGLSESAVKMRISRSLQRVKSLLGEKRDEKEE